MGGGDAAGNTQQQIAGSFGSRIVRNTYIELSETP